MHSNAAMNFNGGGTVTGACTAAGAINVNGALQCAGVPTPDGPVLPMPVWTVSELEAAPAARTFGTQGSPVTCSLSGSTLTCPATVCATGCAIAAGTNLVIFGNLTVNGSASYSGSIVTVNGGININGAFSGAGSDNGVTLAAINTSGGGSGPGINVNGSGAVSDGALYAPDGTINFNGAANVTGSVVGYTINFNGGVNIDNPGNITFTMPVQGPPTLVG